MKIFCYAMLFSFICSSSNNFAFDKNLVKHAVAAVTNFNKLTFPNKKIKNASLDVLLFRKCDAHCPFCIENTIENNHNDRSAEIIVNDINRLIESGIVSSVRLLGGEPMDYPQLEYVCKNLKLKPSITTNGCTFIKDHGLIKVLNPLLKTVNISIPHYSEAKRKYLMGYRGFSNRELFQAMKKVSIPTRMNTLLIKGFIGDRREINKQVLFASKANFSEIAFKELVATDTSIHNYINPNVVMFNHKHFVKIDKLWTNILVKKTNGSFIKVLFAPATIDGIQDYALPLVLFNDGKLGQSWKRAKALPNVDIFLKIQSNIKA